MGTKQVCRFINELLPSNARPCYLQFYFYDTNHEIENCMNLSSKLKILMHHLTLSSS